MIPDSVVMGAGWFFIWSMCIGLCITGLMIVWDKVANRIDRIWIRGAQTYDLKRIKSLIDWELEVRGELK